MARKKLVAGNWKLNGSKVSIDALLDGIKSGFEASAEAEVAVCPPFVYLPLVQGLLSGTGIRLGAQDVSEQAKGAYTGEVSAEMLHEIGCDYAIIGHSERRHIYGETNALVAEKFSAAQAAELIPILCVGELLEERERGKTEAVIADQLDCVIERSGVQALKQSVIAYEPVWAIGTGKTASPEQAQAVHTFIRDRIAQQGADTAQVVQILYGGSVNADNSAELFAQEDIDGGLIGGASLKSDAFLSIYRSAVE